jgi:hypothetical protein
MRNEVLDGLILGYTKVVLFEKLGWKLGLIYHKFLSCES